MRKPRALSELSGNEIHALRQYLMRYAIAELRDPDNAEELVQQALLAALQSQSGFQGRSVLGTWLIAILKHKILDHRRREARNPIVDVVRRDEGEDHHNEVLERLQAAGSWTTAEHSRGDPVKALENRRLWNAVESGLRKLPAMGAQAFCMRELQGVDTNGICDELGISAANCWVMVHRARLGLRATLGESGFGANA